MIQQRADALVALIARQRELSIQVRQLDGFRGQLQEVGQAFAQLAPLMRTWRLLCERGIGTVVPDTQALTVLQQLVDLRERYERDRTSILGPNRLASIRSVNALANALQVRLLGEWQEFAGALVPSVNDDVLNVLNRIPALKAGVDAVWRGLRELDHGLQRLPADAAEVDAFEARAREIRSMWEAFDSAHLPPDVLQFLKDAGGAGAALDALTATVREWLRENKLGSAFRIRSLTAVGIDR